MNFTLLAEDGAHYNGVAMDETVDNYVYENQYRTYFIK